jgi:hypothetical protein
LCLVFCNFDEEVFQIFLNESLIRLVLEKLFFLVVEHFVESIVDIGDLIASFWKHVEDNTSIREIFENLDFFLVQLLNLKQSKKVFLMI